MFCVRAMECLCAQTRPQFILSSKRVLGNGVRSQANSKEKSPLWEAERKVELSKLHHAGQKPSTPQTELFLPQNNRKCGEIFSDHIGYFGLL